MALDLRETETFRLWNERLRDRLAGTIIAARLLRLAEGLPEDVAPIGDGVSELRIHTGPGYRVYFQRRGAVLAHVAVRRRQVDSGARHRDGETAGQRMERQR